MNWDLERVRGVLVDWILVIVCVRFVIGQVLRHTSLIISVMCLPHRLFLNLMRSTLPNRHLHNLLHYLPRALYLYVLRNLNLHYLLHRHMLNNLNRSLDNLLNSPRRRIRQLYLQLLYLPFQLHVLFFYLLNPFGTVSEELNFSGQSCILLLRIMELFGQGFYLLEELFETVFVGVLEVDFDLLFVGDLWANAQFVVNTDLFVVGWDHDGLELLDGPGSLQGFRGILHPGDILDGLHLPSTLEFRASTLLFKNNGLLEPVTTRFLLYHITRNHSNLPISHPRHILFILLPIVMMVNPNILNEPFEFRIVPGLQI